MSAGVHPIPAGVVEAYFALVRPDPDAAEALRPCGRKIGDRVELDLDAVAVALGEGLAADLRRWDSVCRDFARRFSAGEALGPWVSLRRPLLRARPREEGSATTYLREECAALLSLAGVGAAVDAALEAHPDRGAVERLCAHAAGSVAWPEDGVSRLEFSVEGAPTWPLELGGPPAQNEFTRWLVVTIRHAAWRDRKVRRLVSLDVDAEEVWPDPEYVETPPVGVAW